MFCVQIRSTSQTRTLGPRLHGKFVQAIKAHQVAIYSYASLPAACAIPIARVSPHGLGASAIMTVHIELMQVFAIQIPYLGFLLAEFLYVILLCPFLLVSYSHHCGVINPAK